jgi:hypothetical protein
MVDHVKAQSRKEPNVANFVALRGSNGVLPFFRKLGFVSEGKIPVPREILEPRMKTFGNATLMVADLTAEFSPVKLQRSAAALNLPAKVLVRHGALRPHWVPGNIVAVKDVKCEVSYKVAGWAKAYNESIPFGSKRLRIVDEDEHAEAQRARKRRATEEIDFRPKPRWWLWNDWVTCSACEKWRRVHPSTFKSYRGYLVCGQDRHRPLVTCNDRDDSETFDEESEIHLCPPKEHVG